MIIIGEAENASEYSELDLLRGMLPLGDWTVGTRGKTWKLECVDGRLKHPLEGRERSKQAIDYELKPRRIQPLTEGVREADDIIVVSCASQEGLGKHLDFSALQLDCSWQPW